MEMHSPTAVEARSLKPQCWQGLSLLEVLRGKLAQASLPAVGGYWHGLVLLGL